MLEIVELAYQAAADPGLWPTVLERMADAFGADSAIILRRKLTPTMARLDPEAVRLYLDHYSELNPIQAEVDGAEPGRKFWAVTTDLSWIDKRRLMASPFYNDYFQPFGMHAALMMRLGSPATGPSLNLLRGRRKGDFDQSEIELATALHGPLVRAQAMGMRLGAERRANETLVEAIERSAGAVLLVERSGRVAYASLAAEALMRGPAVLAVRAGAITAPGEAGRELARAIGRATAMEVGPDASAMISLPREDGSRPLLLIVGPAGAQAGESRRAIICISDPERPAEVRQDRLRSLFGLTPAEAKAVGELVTGGDAGAIAERLGLSVHTVRVQLARAMAKTQTHRRSELVALVVGGLPAPN